MDRNVLPTVVTVGVREAQASLGRVWTELADGCAVHVVDKRTGRHRGWLVRDLEDGYQPRRVGCENAARRFGGYLAAVRDGDVFECYDHHASQVRGYIQWCAPDAIARLDTAIRFAGRRTRGGRVPVRTIRPTEVMARSL